MTSLFRIINIVALYKMGKNVFYSIAEYVMNLDFDILMKLWLISATGSLICVKYETSLLFEVFLNI